MPRACILVAPVLAALASMGPGAAGDVVTANDTLRIEFTVTGNYTLVPDVLALNLGTVMVLQPYGARLAELYDGGTLLGPASKTSFGGMVGPLGMAPANSWRHPGSPWSFDTPGTADFTAIRDGTIQGRIDWRPMSGAVDITLSQVTLSLGQATGPTSRFIVEPAPVITVLEIIGSCEADYDGNGRIEPADVSLFVATWFTSITQGTLAGDFDGNGEVQPADVSLFIGRWFQALTNGCA